MRGILDNIYIDRFLLVAFVKYILSQIYSHCIWNCTFWYFLEIVVLLFFKENIFKIFIYLLFPKTSNFHIWGVVSRRKLPDPFMNNIFNVFWIGLQSIKLVYPLIKMTWFWPEMPCYNNVKRSILRIQGYCTVSNFPISERGRNCNSLFKLFDNKWVIIIEQRRKIEFDN